MYENKVENTFWGEKVNTRKVKMMRIKALRIILSRNLDKIALLPLPVA